MTIEYVVQLYNPDGEEDGGAIFYRRDWAEEWADHYTLKSLWRSEITEREAEDEHAALIARYGWEDDGERGRR